MKLRNKLSTLSIALLLVFSLVGCTHTEPQATITPHTIEQSTEVSSFDYDSIPEYTNKAYVEYNNNTPLFTEDEITSKSYESYAELDSLGRCGVTIACLGTDTMPTEERGGIGSVKPSGWHTVKYNGLVDGNYLYNRCHLIGYQLSGENANNKNLITGTRYLNIAGMLDFENDTADYIRTTQNHVMYRVTPIFISNELVARGVLMEGYSVEDNGSGLKFCVFAYNVQPGITINYTTGESSISEQTSSEQTTEASNATSSTTYILNTNSKKYHLDANCSAVKSMSESNKQEITVSNINELPKGYTPCKICCKE